MFPSLVALETYVAEANFAPLKQGNVSESSASETFVSQFSHPRKHVWKQCFRVKPGPYAFIARENGT